jgi:hypothetical protein
LFGEKAFQYWEGERGQTARILRLANIFRGWEDGILFHLERSVKPKDQNVYASGFQNHAI